MLEHSTYSPDVISNYFVSILEYKEILKGRHFDDMRSITTAALKAIPRNQSQDCFEG
jgi:hypothetical protein